MTGYAHWATRVPVRWSPSTLSPRREGGGAFFMLTVVRVGSIWTSVGTKPGGPPQCHLFPGRDPANHWHPEQGLPDPSLHRSCAALLPPAFDPKQDSLLEPVPESWPSFHQEPAPRAARAPRRVIFMSAWRRRLYAFQNYASLRRRPLHRRSRVASFGAVYTDRT